MLDYATRTSLFWFAVIAMRFAQEYAKYLTLSFKEMSWAYGDEKKEDDGDYFDFDDNKKRKDDDDDEMDEAEEDDEVLLVQWKWAIKNG